MLHFLIGSKLHLFYMLTCVPVLLLKFLFDVMHASQRWAPSSRTFTRNVASKTNLYPSANAAAAAAAAKAKLR